MEHGVVYKMKKLMLCLILGIFLVSFTSAQIQTLGTFKLGDDINLEQHCASCTFVNITSVTAPNSTQVIGNFPMTKTGSVYNFTLISGNITQVGEYIVNTIGDLDGTNTVSPFNFFVTKSGLDLDISESILYFLLMVFIFVLLAGFIFLAIHIPYSNETDEQGAITRITRAKYLKLFFIWLSSGFLVLFLSMLSGIFNNFINLDIFSSLVTNLYLFMYGMNFILTFLVLGIAMIEIYRDILFDKEIIKFGKAIMNGR